MAILGGGQPAGYYIKRSPVFKKGDMAGMGKGNKIVYARMPKDYPLTSQQKKVRSAAQSCGIKRGISRKDLIDKMKNCMKGKI